MPKFIRAYFAINKSIKEQKPIPVNAWLNTDRIEMLYSESGEQFAALIGENDTAYQISGDTCGIETALDELYESDMRKSGKKQTKCYADF